MERSSSEAADRSLRAVAPVLGLVSTTLVALGACAPAFSFRDGRWGWAPVDAIGDVVGLGGGLVSAVGVTGVLLAWWLLRPGPGRPAMGARVAVLWSLPLLLAPPVLSSDAFAYADIGWMAHVGADLDVDPRRARAARTPTLSTRSGRADWSSTPSWPCAWRTSAPP